MNIICKIIPFTCAGCSRHSAPLTAFKWPGRGNSTTENGPRGIMGKIPLLVAERGAGAILVLCAASFTAAVLLHQFANIEFVLVFS